MAIRSNSKSIDFTFDFETPNGASLSYPLRFHHTEDFGPSLSVLDENKEIAITFPATMFSEVYEFLIEQDIIETKVSKLSVPQPKSKPLSVPKPRPPFWLRYRKFRNFCLNYVLLNKKFINFRKHGSRECNCYFFVFIQNRKRRTKIFCVMKSQRIRQRGSIGSFEIKGKIYTFAI
jgi:hypothetical protein